MTIGPLYPHQLRVLQSPARDIALVWHRQAGKTELGIRLLLARSGQIVGDHLYVAPYFRQAKLIVWNRLLAAFRPVVRAVDSQDGVITRTNNSRVIVYGADVDPDRLRGLSLATVVYDEVAQLPEAIYREVLPPALSRWGDQAVQLWIGTPKGRDHWHDLYHRLEARYLAGDRTVFAQRLTVDDTGLVSKSFLDRMRAIMHPSLYAQEYYCAWVESGVQFLTAGDLDRVSDPACGRPDGYRGGPVVIGWDVARERHPSVVACLERSHDTRVWHVREIAVWRSVPLTDQITLFRRVAGKYRVAKIVVDRTGQGEMVYDTLKNYYPGRVEGIRMSETARERIFWQLRDAIVSDRPWVRIPPDPELRADLLSIRLDQRRRRGGVSLDERDDSHGDRAVALALALAETHTVPVHELATHAHPRAPRPSAEIASTRRRSWETFRDG